MAHETEVANEGRQEGAAPSVQLQPTSAQLLIEQYKLLEERRKYFGSQFMQTTGGVGAILSVLVGLLGGKPQNWVLLRSALLIGGIAFVLLAFLGFRLGKRQDDCERSMGEIETCLHSMGYAMVARMPTGAKTFGARKAIVFFLIALGTVLAAIGLVRW